MSFESKGISMTTCHIPPGEEIDWEEIKQRITLSPVPSEDIVKEEPQWGWSAGCASLMKPTMDNIMVDQDIMHFRYTMLERKIPSATKGAHIDLRSQERMEKTGMQFLSRKEKKEIRTDVSEALLDQMPCVVTSVEILYRLNSKTLFIGSTSENAVDSIVTLLTTKAGFPPIFPLNAVSRATVLTEGKSSEFIGPVQFTEHYVDTPAPGQDFMTWLWHACVDPDSYDGKFALGEEELVVMIGASINMAYESNKVAFNNETACSSKGAIYALKSGYKPVKYKLKVGFRGQVWALTLDADTMTYASVTLPDSEELDTIERFRERVAFIEMLDSFMNNLYFLHLSSMHEDAESTIKEVADWIEEADLDSYF